MFYCDVQYVSARDAEIRRHWMLFLILPQIIIIIIVCNVSDRRSVHPSQVSWFKSFCPSRTEPLRVLVQAQEEAAAEKKANQEIGSRWKSRTTG